AYHNNRYALLLFAEILSFAPSNGLPLWKLFGDAEGSPREGPLWAQRLAQAQLALIYLASGTSKLLDPDWRGGAVIADRLARSFHRSVSMGVPPWLMEWLAQPEVASAFSKGAIATELFLAVGLFVPRIRGFALYAGFVFHFMIEVTSDVELFGWLCLTL